MHTPLPPPCLPSGKRHCAWRSLDPGKSAAFPSDREAGSLSAFHTGACRLSEFLPVFQPVPTRSASATGQAAGTGRYTPDDRALSEEADASRRPGSEALSGFPHQAHVLHLSGQSPRRCQAAVSFHQVPVWKTDAL